MGITSANRIMNNVVNKDFFLESRVTSSSVHLFTSRVSESRHASLIDILFRQRSIMANYILEPRSLCHQQHHIKFKVPFTTGNSKLHSLATKMKPTSNQNSAAAVMPGMSPSTSCPGDGSLLSRYTTFDTQLKSPKSNRK